MNTLKYIGKECMVDEVTNENFYKEKEVKLKYNYFVNNNETVEKELNIVDLGIEKKEEGEYVTTSFYAFKVYKEVIEKLEFIYEMSKQYKEYFSNTLFSEYVEKVSKKLKNLNKSAQDKVENCYYIMMSYYPEYAKLSKTKLATQFK